MSETLYKQVLIEYEDDHSSSICWIPERFAHLEKSIIIGKTKQMGRRAQVKEVLSTKSEIEEHIHHTHKFSYIES